METADPWGSASTHWAGEELTWEQALLSPAVRGAGSFYLPEAANPGQVAEPVRELAEGSGGSS